VYPIQSCIVTGGDVLADRPRRRREVTVERLLDAALDTFAELGFAAASVEDVCRRGGFTRGAFYSSFRSKDELFAALFARESARNLALAQQQLAGVEDEDDPVAAAVDRCLSTFRADRTWVLVQAEYRLHAARSPEAAHVLRDHTAAVLGGIAALVADTAGRAGVGLTVPAAALARMVLALHDGLVMARVSGDPDEHDLERTALLALLRGVTTPRPTSP
jgi:AcrR family transcriptional regulator